LSQKQITTTEVNEGTEKRNLILKLCVSEALGARHPVSVTRCPLW
jgi:hypothetical protein